VRGRFNLVFFGIAVLNLAVLYGCLLVHMPSRYAISPFVALVEILFVSLVSEEMGSAAYCPVILPSNGGRREIEKRVGRYGEDGEHPALTRAGWMRAIASNETQESYWEWVTRQEMLAARLLSLGEMVTQHYAAPPAYQPNEYHGMKLMQLHPKK